MFAGAFSSGVPFTGADKAERFGDAFQLFLYGEIFNLDTLGLSGVSSDAHAMATLYAAEGVDAFARVDGAFCCIVVEGGRVIIVRDHHGTGPQLYYNDTYFASSLDALSSCEGFTKNIDYGALATFLSTGYIPTGRSSITGVKKLGAGHALVCDKGRFEQRNLFPTSHFEPVRGRQSVEELSLRYGELHREAIVRRIGNSSNVGILLSGGYDSGSNLAALRDVYDGSINSYSIGFCGDSWSELPMAQIMSNTFGTNHFTYEIDGSEIEALPAIVAHLGDPFVEGGLMVNYAAMRLVGDRKPDVILGGDGSDQYFGTSSREVALLYLASRMGLRPLMKLTDRLLPKGSGEQYRVHFHLNKILNVMGGDTFGWESNDLRNVLLNRSWLEKPDLPRNDLRSFEHLFLQHAYSSDMERIVNQVILFKASRMAEMMGNRIAFPFADLQLYDFISSLPVECRCKYDSVMSLARGNSTAKFLLKHHYKPQLPDAITARKKQGGFAPMPIFFADKARRHRIANFILSSSLLGDFLQRRQVEKFIIDYHTEAKREKTWFWYRQNRAIQYFNLLTLAVWWEQFVKSRRVDLR